jgi:yeast amino acid transporter
MVGGNPTGEAYGFLYWYDPGAFNEYLKDGDLGRFLGFLAAVYSAGFTVVGPEYLAMVAGEAMRPRTYIKQGFKTVYWRFGFFFIGGALCVSIIIPYDDPKLADAESNANGSPYVIAMQNFGIPILPHIVNALLCTSIYSAGNAYTYCAMRSLYGLALEGQAPKIFSKTIRNGIPIYAFAVVMLFPFLAFLQVGDSAAQVVSYLQSVTQAAQMMNYIIMGITYMFFYRACQAQGLDRKTLPYVGYFQPYCAYIGTAWMVFVVFTYGWEYMWKRDTLQCFLHYGMLIIAVFTFTIWKLVKRTKVIKPWEADLIWEKPQIDAYEASLEGEPASLTTELLQMIGLRKKKENVMAEKN